MPGQKLQKPNRNRTGPRYYSSELIENIRPGQPNGRAGEKNEMRVGLERSKEGPHRRQRLKL